MARLYLEALLCAEGRKTASQIASYLGESRSDAVQRLLGSARWDADRVRDELLGAVTCRGDHTEGTLVLHHRCFPKKGVRSVGVEDHFCPRQRRTEHSQVAVLAVFEVGGRRFLVDRELFLPHAWADDPCRRHMAGVPDWVPYRSMSDIAANIVERCSRILPVRHVVAAREFSEDVELDRALEAAAVPHVLEMSDTQLRTLATACRSGRQCGGRQILVRRRHGSREPWSRVPVPQTAPPGWDRFALVRAGAAEPVGVVRSGPSDLVLDDAVSTAAVLRRADECVTRACDLGLDSYECRSWTSWYRHVTLVCSASFCSVG